MIQFRMTAEKFQGNLRLAALDDFTCDSPCNQVKCTTLPFPSSTYNRERTILNVRTYLALDEIYQSVPWPQSIASTEQACTFPSALTAP
jgi:hypothetical protein